MTSNERRENKRDEVYPRRHRELEPLDYTTFRGFYLFWTEAIEIAKELEELKNESKCKKNR